MGSGVLVCEGMGSVEGVGVKFIKFGPVIDVELQEMSEKKEKITNNNIEKNCAFFIIPPITINGTID